MKLDDVLELYQLISIGTQNIPDRKRSIQMRKAGLENYISGGFNKVAFDTRRIDQEVEYNPRRGLQNYNRSEPFISEAMSQKIKNFSKLRRVLLGLKEVYGKEPEWLDSNARVLLSTLDKGLRVGIKDGDFSESQPSMGSLDYIEELMYVRYRLGFDDLAKMGEPDLQRVILSRDEELIYKEALMQGDENCAAPIITKRNVASQSYDSLVNKAIDASKENSKSDKTVNITINLGG